MAWYNAELKAMRPLSRHDGAGWRDYGAAKRRCDMTPRRSDVPMMRNFSIRRAAPCFHFRACAGTMRARPFSLLFDFDDAAKRL